MTVFVELQFDAVNDDGDERAMTIIGRFRDLEQIEEWRDGHNFDSSIEDINLSLPVGWTVGGPVEIGELLPEMTDRDSYHVDLTVEDGEI